MELDQRGTVVAKNANYELGRQYLNIPDRTSFSFVIQHIFKIGAPRDKYLAGHKIQ